jgi:chromosome segregation ATPase
MLLLRSNLIAVFALVGFLSLQTMAENEEPKTEKPKTEKSEYLEQAEVLQNNWIYRVAEVLTKRDVYPGDSQEAKALKSILEDLRDRRDRAEDDFESLQEAKSDWKSHLSAIEADCKEIDKVYEKSLSY